MRRKLEIQPYNPTWPQLARDEQRTLRAITGAAFVALEHIGSTAIPGLAAKPIIDLMGAVRQLDDVVPLIPVLTQYGYHVIDTDIPERYFLRKHDEQLNQLFHLHIVEAAGWDERNERLFRDYLQAHPDLASAYGRLKQQLVGAYAHDRAAYTKAKTEFIQSIVDQAWDAQGLPRVSVWEE